MFNMVEKKINPDLDNNILFCGNSVPDINIADYISRIKKYCFSDDDDDDILSISLSYINRLSIIINKNCHHNIVMTSILLAIKYEMDEHHSNKFYAAVGGQTLSELNKFEIDMLKLLNWNVNYE
jgi:hypothetical protein